MTDEQILTSGWTSRMLGFESKNAKILKDLENQIDDAATYDEWLKLAEEHDKYSGAELWKRRDESDLYDYLAIRTRIDRLRRLRLHKDDHGLLFALNEGIHGNMGGMGKPILYTKAKVGTKNLINDYIQEISDALEYLAFNEFEDISAEERFDFFRRASLCYGRSALMLSGGGALGNFHLGVIKVLIEQGLLPEVISGASAGAFIAALVGTHTDEEILEMFADGSLITGISVGAGKFQFKFGKRELDGYEEVEKGIARMLPDMTFQEAYEKTGRSINISISPHEAHQRSRLLNSVASPNVTIRSAVLASCAIPGVFPPVTLKAKNEKGEEQFYLPTRRWVDGSFSQDLPAKRLTRLYGVNHFIVSQVNPAVLPLLSDPNLQSGSRGALSQFVRNISKESMRNTLDYLQRSMNFGPRVNLTLNTIHALVDQEYTGDINIFPNFRYFNPKKIVSAIGEEEIRWFVEEGAKATFPKVASIETNTRVGRTLDQIMHQLEKEEMEWLRTAPEFSLDKEGKVQGPKKKSKKIA